MAGLHFPNLDVPDPCLVNIHIVTKLQAALGGELAAASRPMCVSGLLSMERQVRSSVQTVAPKMYMAVGISGAIQHLVGMKGAQTIVAINKDENAPGADCGSEKSEGVEYV